MSDLKTECPHCGQHLACDEAWRGRQIPCPACGKIIEIPALEARAVPDVEVDFSPPPAPPPRRNVFGSARPRYQRKLATLAVVPIIAFLFPWLAVRSFGIWSFLLSVVGVVCGHLALRQIKHSTVELSGKHLTIVGLVLCYALVFLVVFLGIPNALETRRQIEAATRELRTSMGMLRDAQLKARADGRLPMAAYLSKMRELHIRAAGQLPNPYKQLPISLADVCTESLDAAKRFDASFDQLQFKPGGDFFGTIKSKNDLAQRRAEFEEFRNRCGEIAAWMERLPATVDNKLQTLATRYQFPQRNLEAFKRGFLGTAADQEKAIQIVRQTGRIASLITNLLDVLDRAWGRWQVIPATKQIVFRDPMAMADFNQRVQELQNVANALETAIQTFTATTETPP